MLGRISEAHRGKHLELLVDLATEVYNALGTAFVYAVPPEAVISRGASGVVRSARYKTKGGFDRVCMVKGRPPVAFDCKCTRQKNFPLKNVELHQLEWASKFERHGGRAYLLIEFDDDTADPPRYMVPISFAWKAINDGLKTIPRDWCEKCPRIGENRDLMVALDWLAVL